MPRAHVADTIAILNQMRLDADDLIYFSELVESEGFRIHPRCLRRRPAAAHLRRSASPRASRSSSALHFDERRGVPHISRYDIREFVY